ncbi:MAG: AMP-binding protein [Alistipes sp.]|nr:AMP-binding protein [Alistipes sp.]
MKLKTLYEILNNSVKNFSERIAFSLWRGGSYTFKQVGEKVAEVQELLRSAGLKKGDKVVLLSSNMPNWGVCYFAITTGGYTVVPVLPDFTSADLDRIVEHSEAKAMCVSDKLFTKISKELSSKLNIIVRTKNLSVLSQNVHEEGEITIPQPEDLAAIIYTSGTTSAPKGVMLTHYNIASQMWLIDPLFLVREDDIFLSVLPMAHTYECTLGLILAFHHGAHVAYLDKAPTVSVLLPALKEIRPTIMLTVPLIIEKIYKGKVKKQFTSSGFMRALYGVGFIRRYLHRIAGKKLTKTFGGRVRFFGIGGAKLDAEVEQFLLEARFIYDIGYGLTETAPLIAGAVDGMLRLGSTGPILKGIEYRLENMNEDGIGELVVKSPSQMQGYYKNPEATAAAFTEDGFFRTGDLCSLDDDGWLYIKGRCKNMILGPSGENIYPEDIENVLNSHVFISESVVTEMDGKLVALVHFDTEALEAKYSELVDTWHKKKHEFTLFKEEMMQEVKNFVNERVNRNSKIAEVVEEEQEFEKTATKKIRRFLYTKKKNDEQEK